MKAFDFHWKWVVAHFLSRLLTQFIQRVPMDSMIAYMIAIFIVWQIFYFVPPVTKVAYLKFSLLLLAFTIWGVLTLKVLLDYFAQKHSSNLAFVFAFIIFCIPQLLWVIVIHRKNKHA